MLSTERRKHILEMLSTEYKSIRKNDVVYGPDLNIEIDRNGLGHFVFEKCKQHANKTFQINSETGESETYAQICEKSVRIALHLKKLGIKKGDIVATCSRQNVDVIAPIFSTLFLNAISVSADPSMSVRDTVYLFGKIRPKIIFVDPDGLKLVEETVEKLRFEMQIVVMGRNSKYLQVEDFLKYDPDEKSFIPTKLENDRDTAIIFFSSGTTGMPKAIECSSFGFLTVMENYRQTGVNLDVCHHVSSFYWISAYIITLVMMIDGGKKIVVPHFEPRSTMKLFEKYKVTFSFMAPYYGNLLTKENTSPYDTSSLDTLMFGGGPMTAKQIENVRTYFPNALITLGYGQTECTGFISTFSKIYSLDLSRQKPTSSGILSAGMKGKIVDPNTETTLGINQIGEIRLSANFFLNGYYNGDSSGVFDADGYLKTGDLGYFDEDNCIYVCDRIKDMLKYQSWHIVPTSIEKVIYEHPAVKQTVVFGIPDEIDGDHPMALVVLNSDYNYVSETEIKDFVEERVLDREKLRAGLKIVTELPKSITGKILRKNIREMVLNREI